MVKQRAKLIDDDLASALSSIPEGSGKTKNNVSKADIKKVSESANFVSREAPKPMEKRQQRRHRTGRNIQFATKLSKETFDSVYTISDQQNWLIAETIENALAALQEKLKKS